MSSDSGRTETLGVAAVVAIGTGGMIGAGIFALLGVAVAAAGAGVWVAFPLGSCRVGERLFLPAPGRSSHWLRSQVRVGGSSVVDAFSKHGLTCRFTPVRACIWASHGYGAVVDNLRRANA